MTPFRRYGFSRCNVLAVGSEPSFRQLVEKLRVRAGMQFDEVKYLQTPETDEKDRVDRTDVAEIERMVNEDEIDQLVFSSPYQLNGSFDALYALCRRKGVSMRIVSPEFDSLFSKVRLRDIKGIPIYVPRPEDLRLIKRMLKRSFDVFGAIALLVALSPLFLLVALAIKLESRGPVFFRHLRSLGAGDTPFSLLKFRSMRPKADTEKPTLLCQNESNGALFKIKDDPRLTRVGRIIRRFSIDELPQLVNVLKGEMSLVGPRPLPVTDYARINENDHIEGYLGLRSKVKPGMTGLWQVSGRSHLGFREMVMLDLYYIENYTLLLDLAILAQTVPVVVFGKGAY